MDKVVKNERDVELVTCCSSGHKTGTEKLLYSLYIISDQVWWYNVKRFWVIPKIASAYPKTASANLCKSIHDIVNYSTCTCPFESRNCGKEGKKLQKFEYIKKEKSFLDEVKYIFHSSQRAIILWKNKNLRTQALIFGGNHAY